MHIYIYIYIYMIACATMHTGPGSLYMWPSMVLFIPTMILIMRATNPNTTSRALSAMS